MVVSVYLAQFGIMQSSRRFPPKSGDVNMAPQAKSADGKATLGSSRNGRNLGGRQPSVRRVGHRDKACSDSQNPELRGQGRLGKVASIPSQIPPSSRSSRARGRNNAMIGDMGIMDRRTTRKRDIAPPNVPKRQCSGNDGWRLETKFGDSAVGRDPSPFLRIWMAPPSNRLCTR